MAQKWAGPRWVINMRKLIENSNRSTRSYAIPKEALRIFIVICMFLEPWYFKGCFVSPNGWSMWFWTDLDSSAGLHIHSFHLQSTSPHNSNFMIPLCRWVFSLSGGNICSRQRPPEPGPTCLLPLSSRPAKPGGHNSYWAPEGQHILRAWRSAPGAPGSLPGLGWASFLSHVMPEKWGSHLPLRTGLSRNSS